MRHVAQRLRRCGRHGQADGRVDRRTASRPWICMPSVPTRFGNYYANPEYAAERTRNASSTIIACASPMTNTNGHARTAPALCTSACRNSARCSARNTAGNASITSSPDALRMAGEDQRKWGWTKPPFFERLRVRARGHSQATSHLYDLSSFGKIDAARSGRPSALLQRVADSDMDQTCWLVLSIRNSSTATAASKPT